MRQYGKEFEHLGHTALFASGSSLSPQNMHFGGYKRFNKTFLSFFKRLTSARSRFNKFKLF